MATNQELRQASIVADIPLSAAGTYNGDWMRLFNAASIPDLPFNARFLAWINASLGTSYTNLPGAMQAYAASQGPASWDDMGTFTP